MDDHGPRVYAQARANLDALMADGTLVQDDTPCFYLYRQTWQGRTQVGLMAVCSVEEYDEGTIKKHELTRPTKEQDRVDHIDALDAQTGLVFLAFRDQYDDVRAALAEARALTPDWSVTTDDAVEHALTVVSDPALVERLQAAFRGVDALYIADGHHRSAAASRIHAARAGAGTSGWFPAGIFPSWRSWPTTASWPTSAATTWAPPREARPHLQPQHRRAAPRARHPHGAGTTTGAAAPGPAWCPQTTPSAAWTSRSSRPGAQPLLGIENPRTDTLISSSAASGARGPRGRGRERCGPSPSTCTRRPWRSSSRSPTPTASCRPRAPFSAAPRVYCTGW